MSAKIQKKSVLLLSLKLCKMKNIEAYFQDFTKGLEPSNLYEPMRYILTQGGKRLRPHLVLSTTQALDGNIIVAEYVAEAFEMLHNFTLIHDDIMDDAPIRRGMPTVYKKWNSNIAILSGDALATMALRRLLVTPCPETIRLKLIDIFTETSLLVCEGQQYDLDNETDDTCDLAAYLLCIEKKTAALLVGCLRSAAILSEREDCEHALSVFGTNLGIAFQLKDDYLDLYSENIKFGKTKGGDILANKKTFLYFSALKHACKEDNNALIHYFSISDMNPDEKIKAVKEIFDRCNVQKDVEKWIDIYISKAYDALRDTNLPEEKLSDLFQLLEQLKVRTV